MTKVRLPHQAQVYAQMAGRALRPHDNQKTLVVDYTAPVGSYRAQHGGRPRFYIRKWMHNKYGAFMADYRTSGGHLFGPLIDGCSADTVAGVLANLQRKFG